MLWAYASIGAFFLVAAGFVFAALLFGKLVRPTNPYPEKVETYECGEAPVGLARFISTKGSVSLDGVSLTVNDVVDNRFSVCLIPHTLDVTSLGALAPGDEVNIEVDMIARYLERLMQGEK